MSAPTSPAVAGGGEATDAELLRFGWAPGSYMAVCVQCRQQHHSCQKRAMLCRPCAVEAWRDACETRDLSARVQRVADAVDALSPPAGAGAAGLDDHFAVVRNAAVALAQRAGQCPAVDGLIAESGTACGALSAEFRALRATLARQAADLERLRAGPRIEFHQADWIPGFAAFVDDGKKLTRDPNSRAFCVLNLGSFLAAIQTGDLSHEDLAGFIADSMCHEVLHVIEKWCEIEFSEDRVNGLLDKYRLDALSPDRGSEVRPEGGGEGGAK